MPNIYFHKFLEFWRAELHFSSVPHLTDYCLYSAYTDVVSLRCILASVVRIILVDYHDESSILLVYTTYVGPHFIQKKSRPLKNLYVFITGIDSGVLELFLENKSTSFKVSTWTVLRSHTTCWNKYFLVMYHNIASILFYVCRPRKLVQERRRNKTITVRF